MFFNEFDLLELRLRQHYSSVDRFLIVECDRTYTGVYKGFRLEEKLERYRPWWDKVDYLKIENSPQNSNPWENEKWQRNQMNNGWQNIEDDAVLIVNDLDEILRPETFDFIRASNYRLYKFHMPVFYLKYNYMAIGHHYAAWGRGVRGWRCDAAEMHLLDRVPNGVEVSIHHAGWHFSWIGNEDFIKNKLSSFSHSELDTSTVRSRINVDQHIKEGRDHLGRGGEWAVVALDNYFPEYIVNNIQAYSDFIAQQNSFSKSVLDIYPHQVLEVFGIK